MLVKIRSICDSVSETFNFNTCNEIHFLNTSDILEGNIINDLIYKKSELKGQAKKSIRNHDILFSEIRPKNKRYAFVNLSHPENYVVSTKLMVLRLKENIKVSLQYFYYSITNDDFLDKLQRKAENRIGSFPQITFDILSDFYINIPSLEEQEKIANILSMIDDQVKRNNAIVKRLQVLVKAIYNHWFIKFDYPETSKGRVYNSTLKKDIPQGWKVKSIKDCLIHINTGLNPRNNFTLNNGDVKYITVKNLTPNGSIDFSNCDTISQETKELINKRSLVSKGDILFASIAPLGRCVLVNETPSNWEINESVFSIRVNTEIVSPEYLFLFFMSDYFVKTAENSSTGSIFSGIRISTLEEMKVLIPEKNILEKFNSIVFPLLVKKYEIEQQNEKLKKLKDTLLPLLINGQLQ